VEFYVPYQERLFHVDREMRDLTNQYVQADQQICPMRGPRSFSLAGSSSKASNEILHNYIEKPKRAVPASVALRAWEVENKLPQASALYCKTSHS
jgi:hypothetical protein